MASYPTHLRHFEASLARVKQSGMLDSLFPEAIAKATVPWPRAPRLPGGFLFDRGAVGVEFEHERPAVAFLDPATLWASQPGVTRAGVEYYLGLRWWVTGETYADKHSVFNRLPVVEVRPDGKHVILNGHHRSSAALLQGRRLLARCVDTAYRPRVDLRAPGLAVGAWSDAQVADGVEQAKQLLQQGLAVRVAEEGTATAVVAELATGFT